MEFNKLNISAIILALIVLVVLFSAAGSIVPEIQTAGNSFNGSNNCNDLGCHWNVTGTNTTQCQVADGQTALCATNHVIPFAGLFGGSGVLLLILIAGLVFIVVRQLKK